MNLNDTAIGSPQAVGGLPLPPSPPLAEAHPMDTLLSENLGLDMPAVGELREGAITHIGPSEILVDVGAKSEGVIAGKELERIDARTRSSLEVGQKVWVYVLSPEDRNGNIVLSLTRAQEEKDWRNAEELLASQSVYEGQVAGFNKGGLIVRVGNVRGFIPASQFGLSRRRRVEGETPEAKFSKMVGEKLHIKVIEVDRGRNRLILSERAAAKETREAQKERLLTELKTGDVRTGRIISLANFGVFVDLGGADGLVHLSELTWKRIAHPRDMFKVGQEVEVVVLGVDRERKRITLSMKQREEDPWSRITRKYKIGQLVEGTITKLAKFGAFARLTGDEEIEGLIHISELSEGRITHPKEVVQEGQVVTLRVVKIEPDKRRMGLSLKRVASAEYADMDWPSEADGASDDFEDVDVEDDFDADDEE